MTAEKTEFIPFNAVNEFMREDFRNAVLRTVFDGLNTLPLALRKEVDLATRKLVSIPGFRNSVAAPVALKARHAVGPFEKNAAFTANILQAWTALHLELGGQVHALLTSLGWTLLPLDSIRTKLPGFLTEWPQGQDFEAINRAFQDSYPQSTANPDEVSMMAVWLSGKLPVKTTILEQDQAQRGIL